MFPLTIEQLRKDVADKKIDTVVVAMTDMQGRLVGKRLDAKLLFIRCFKAWHRGL